MIEAKIVETKRMENGKQYTFISLSILCRSEVFGAIPKYFTLYNGLDNEQAEKVRRDVSIMSFKNNKEHYTTPSRVVLKLEHSIT